MWRANDSPKVEASWDHSVPAARHSKGTSTHTSERRLGRDLDRKDQWMETAKPDIQRKSWWNENWRNNSREAERQPQQRDHRSKPATRHNPIQQPNHPEPNGSVTHRGKVSSALELAQAYSRSASTPNTDDQFSSQTALPGRNQVPFSRLTDNSRHHIKINGYWRSWVWMNMGVSSYQKQPLLIYTAAYLGIRLVFAALYCIVWCRHCGCLILPCLNILQTTCSQVSTFQHQSNLILFSLFLFFLIIRIFQV